MVLSTFQSQTKLQKCFLLNIIELGGLKIAINNAMPKYLYWYVILTEVAGEGGTNWAPQKFLLSQKFRHLMG